MMKTTETSIKILLPSGRRCANCCFRAQEESSYQCLSHSPDFFVVHPQIKFASYARIYYVVGAETFLQHASRASFDVFPAWKIRWKIRSKKSPKEEKSTRKENNDVKNQMEREGSVFAINCEALEIDEDSASLNVIK